MSALVFLLLTATIAVGVLDWAAVQAGMKPLEYVAKPLTMIVLIAAVAAMNPASAGARTLFLVALVFSVIGDVFLMLPDRDRFFPFGLCAFLVAHLAYIPGLWMLGFNKASLVVGLALVCIFVATIGRRVVLGVRDAQPKLSAPVTLYMAVISVMVLSAFGTGKPAALGGAMLFYVSDALIAWNSFIKEYRLGKIAIIVTYHLGQMALALSLM